MRIRQIETAEDVFAAYQFIVSNFLDNALVEPDPQKAMQHMMQVATNGIILEVREDGGIVGVMGVVKVKPWYSSEEILADAFTFAKGGRKGAAMHYLRDEAQACADIAQIPFVLTKTAAKFLPGKKD